MAEWVITVQIASGAQAPGQGSTHFSFRQALFWGQSLFTTHSGRQNGGLPM